MKIAGFDVGSTNLGYCVVHTEDKDSPPRLEKSGVLDIRPLCVADGCERIASEWNYCPLHALLYVPPRKLTKPTAKTLTDMTDIELHSLYERTVGKTGNNVTRKDQVKGVRKAWPCGKKASRPVRLQDAALGIVRELNRVMGNEHIDVAVIENQFAPKANRMLCVQGMLTMFMVCVHGARVEYSAGATKLAHLGKGTTTYGDRKQASVEEAKRVCAVLEHQFPESGKRDDLADAILHALVYAVNAGLCADILSP